MTIAEIWDRDDRRLDRLHNNLDKIDLRSQRELARIVAQNISYLAVENGIVKQTSGNLALLRNLETLLPIRLNPVLDKLRPDILAQVQARLTAADRVWRDLGETSAILGRSIDELPFIDREIQTLTDKISEGNRFAQERVRQSLRSFYTSIDGGSEHHFQVVQNTLVTKSGIAPRYARTIATTGLARIDRGLMSEQGKRAKIDTMKYRGPNDSITRPFCKNHVGQILTRDEWYRMNNDTGPQPVLFYGGGYNCRHRIVPWREEWD